MNDGAIENEQAEKVPTDRGVIIFYTPLGYHQFTVDNISEVVKTIDNIRCHQSKLEMLKMSSDGRVTFIPRDIILNSIYEVKTIERQLNDAKRLREGKQYYPDGEEQA